MNLLFIYHRRDIRPAHEEGPLRAFKQIPELICSRIFPKNVSRSQFSLHLPQTEKGRLVLVNIAFSLAVVITFTWVIHSQNMIAFPGEQIFLHKLLNNLQVVGGWMEQENSVLPTGREVECE